MKGELIIADHIEEMEGPLQLIDEDNFPFNDEIDPFGLLEGGVNSKFYRFADKDTNAIKFTNTVVAVRSTGLVQVQAEVTSKNCYTHTYNRRSWTGPHIKVRVFDSAGFILLDWDTGQANVLCRSNFIYRKEKTVSGIFSDASRVQITYGAYRYSNC